MTLLPLYLTFAIAIGTAYSFGSYKHITVKGITLCGKTRLKSVQVELWEKDTIDPDDLLNTTKTNAIGEFSIYGGQKEVGHIEPYLRFIHSCDNERLNLNCEIKDRHTIPNNFVNGIYDMGYVNLNIPIEDRKRKCA